MGSGGSKTKSNIENKTNNSGTNNNESSSSQSKPGVTSQQQQQVPPQEQKLPVLNDKQSGTVTKTETEETKEDVKLPSMADDSKEKSDKRHETKDQPVHTSNEHKEVKESQKDKITKKEEEGQSSCQVETEEAMKAEGDKEIKVPEVEEKIIPEDPVDQKKFDCALRSTCILVKPESIYKRITKNVTTLHLTRALPRHFSLETLLSTFVNLTNLDLSHNNLGPPGFRAICMAMCGNSTITSLNLADNKSDTDSADCLGRLVEVNKTLQYLDVSSNYLGKDYFSRKVGPALKVNTSLQVLRCESIGTTDARMLIEGLQVNKTLVELDISRNELSDTVGFAKGLAECLKREESTLTTLCLMRCGFNSASLKELMTGLANNTSLMELNLSGSQFDSLDVLLKLMVTASNHPSLYNLSLDNSTVKSPNISADAPVCEQLSVLQILSMNSCGLTDAFFTTLLKSYQGKLLSLIEVDVASNENLSVACIDSLMKMTSAEGQPSSLRKISYGLNKAEEVPAVITNKQLCNLNYLSVRMCRISASSVGQFAKCWGDPDSSLSTLILDGLKLSGTTALKTLLANPKTCKLTTLSLGGCQFDDNDLSPLIDAIKGGLPLHMLKLSANRITDVGVAALVDGLLKNKAAQISVLDLSNNRMTDEGAKSLTKLFGSKSKLNSLNVSSNNIGKDGMVLLSGLFGSKSPLQTLHAQGQTTGLDEPHMIEIYNKLTSSLGYKVQMEGETVKAGCSDLPGNLPDRLLVNYTSMGGQTGSIGQSLDSPCILTDQPGERLPYLTLHHVFTICCFLKGQKEDTCVWSEAEWDMIIGADRPTTDAPSWLKLPDARSRCVYMGNLPGTTTQQKVDALLEMDADCNLEEACLMKDPVTRSVNGSGWALMGDTESIQKALALFNSGEAKIFGQPFIISEVKVRVDNEANSQLQEKAVADLEMRLQLRAKEEASHRKLIVTTTEATWKRHAYRLAHPAYADGRIW